MNNLTPKEERVRKKLRDEYIDGWAAEQFVSCLHSAHIRRNRSLDQQHGSGDVFSSVIRESDCAQLRDYLTHDSPDLLSAVDDCLRDCCEQ